MFHRLILAHLVGDFVLQTRWLVMRKRTPGGLAFHVGLVGLAMLLAAWDRLGAWWPWLLLILLTHAAIDWTKLHLEPRLPWPPILPFLADQAAHALVIALIVLAATGDLSLTPTGADLAWWIASVYLIATFVLSIALPLWLDPPGLMQRPLLMRLTTILAAALALTLAWRGWPLLVPVVGLGLYQGVARRLSRTPTFALEFWGAVLVAASLGWGLI